MTLNYLVYILITTDFDDKPKRLLRNIASQHMYLRMPSDADGISVQLEKIKAAELTHLFLVCSETNANHYLSQVSTSSWRAARPTPTIT